MQARSLPLPALGTGMDAESLRLGAMSEVARAKPASVTEAQTRAFCFSVGAAARRGFTGSLALHQRHAQGSRAEPEILPAATCNASRTPWRGIHTND